MAYDRFALIYDQVMRGVDYPLWVDHILNLARKFEFDSSRVCDLACGTGSLALLLAEKGCEVLGVDRSPTMIEEAKEKAQAAACSSVQWRQADITAFECEQKFSLVTCLYDSVNYLLKREDVAACFERARRLLEPGGGFIFDVTTEYNILVNFADYTFAENFADFSYIWENAYDINSKIITSEVTIFQKNGEQFFRFAETHRQKIYSTKVLEALIRKAGFEILGAFEGFTLNSPGPKAERIHYVCKEKSPSA